MSGRENDEDAREIEREGGTERERERDTERKRGRDDTSFNCNKLQ